MASEWDVVEEAALPPGWDVVEEQPLPGEGMAQPPAPPPAWWEAAFPRASRAVIDREGNASLGAALDLMSLPGRALASLARPEGEGYGEALARTGPPESIPQPGGRLGNEWSDKLAEAILRDPANVALAGATGLTGGLAGPAWLARFGRGAQVAGRMAPASGAVTATQQAEREAAGREFSGSELAGQVALNTALAGIPEGARLAGKGSKALAGKWLTTVLKPTDKARAAGYNPDVLLRELASESATGGIPATMTGLRGAFLKALEERAAGRPAAIAADEARALATGRPARVDMGRAAAAAEDAVAEGVRSRTLTGAIGSAPGASRWAARELRAEQAGPNFATIEEAIKARQGLDKMAFVPTAPAATAARRTAAKAARQDINAQLDEIAPLTRLIDARLAPLMQNAEAVGVVGNRRLNNALLNPADLLVGTLAGGGMGAMQGAEQGAATGIAALLASRLLRTPLPSSALWRTGQGLSLLGRTPPAAPLALKGSRE